MRTYRGLMVGISEPVPLPGGPRHAPVHGRTLAQAAHSDAYEMKTYTEMPMMLSSRPPVLTVGTRAGKHAPLVSKTPLVKKPRGWR